MLSAALRVGFLTLMSMACGPEAAHDRSALALAAIDPDPEMAVPAIAELRALGPAGLESMLLAHDGLLEAARATRPAALRQDATWLRFSAALDAIAGQRDAAAARLYWYTSLDEAEAAAQAAAKPILSLRLLGKLTDEYSCANSRFFRTVLYANQEVSQYLREHFVLHWESVRPVPRVSIDFGDGRVLERTVTGNSIHWVLDSTGRLVDGIPGLYGPKAFLAVLERARQVAATLPASEAEARASIAAYHRTRADEVARERRADLGAVGAAAAAADDPARALDDATWAKIAALHAAGARLDQGSRSLIERQLPDAEDASRIAISKTLVESPLLRLVREFEASIALDTVKNEYGLHRQLHGWLAREPSADLAALNERVYAELFLTPATDPWLGLAPATVYTALENTGRSE